MIVTYEQKKEGEKEEVSFADLVRRLYVSRVSYYN